MTRGKPRVTFQRRVRSPAYPRAERYVWLVYVDEVCIGGTGCKEAGQRLANDYLRRHGMAVRRP